MTRVAAVILAGGKGERMGGVNKALIEIGGVTLLDRALAVTAGCERRLLAVGPAHWDPRRDIECVVDLPTDYAGPLAGVASAVAQIASEPPDVLFSLAVDSPLFPTDFLDRALPLLIDAPAVLASHGAQDYPTNALWRFEDIATLADEVRSGTSPRSLKRLAEGLGATRLDYSEITPADPFLNANTPEDLAFLREQLGAGRAG
jgi:molybdopterin-guanine dinucleotide biosynthesis protein A